MYAAAAPASASTTTWTTTKLASRSLIPFASNNRGPNARFCYVAQTLLSVLMLAACAAPEPATKQTPHRIVTLAPNVTEMVIASGRGPHRRTDDYSADAMPARKLPRVGGLQPNLEKIVAVRPTCHRQCRRSPTQPRPSLASVHIPCWSLQ